MLKMIRMNSVKPTSDSKAFKNSKKVSVKIKNNKYNKEHLMVHQLHKLKISKNPISTISGLLIGLC